MVVEDSSAVIPYCVEFGIEGQKPGSKIEDFNRIVSFLYLMNISAER